MEARLSQPTQHLMIFGQFVCGRSRTHHLFHVTYSPCTWFEFGQILVAHSNTFSSLKINQLLGHITKGNFSKVHMIRDHSLNSPNTKTSLFLQFFYYNIWIIIDNVLNFFNIFRCGPSNMSSSSCSVINLFSTVTKIFRSFCNSPKRRSFVAENST